MTKNREAVVRAKLELYHIILALDPGALTGDDLSMARALLRDSEMKAVFDKK